MHCEAIRPLKIVIVGATGMLGQGALRECLLADDVMEVVTIGRSRSDQRHAKLHDVVVPDLTDLHAVEGALRDVDACFFCLGVTSSGMSEAAYTHITFDLTLYVARTLLRLNPGMRFVYVSGAGADASERGKVMWARVRGRTENALRALPFAAVHVLRPGIIQPLHGTRSKTRAYRVFYALAAPVLPLARRLWPGAVLTTEVIGRAMLNLVRRGAPGGVLESAAIDAAARDPAPTP
ncbi:NAD-dependent epimerase/dehydratase family protein [Uliginosibacterium sp. sgz301328]|uniref:NAD-dependent epimerase/dehydratase family protein n=1 Tax=Uliginosibacterium sp. sgz301328 TaxID=3243764 RepID=UPI00359EAE30